MVWRNNLINAKFWVVIYLYLVNRCSLIKFDQLKMLTAENPSLPLIALHISPTGWVPTISVLTLAVCVQRRMLEQSSSMSSMSSMDWQTFWALYCDITLICQSNVWICDSGTRMRCIRFSSEIRCDRFGRLQQQNICLISPYMSTALPGGLRFVCLLRIDSMVFADSSNNMRSPQARGGRQCHSYELLMP
jgi:hypothetical protein